MDTLATYFDELQQCRLFTRKEELSLIKRAHAGDVDARNALVSSQLRWVVRLARKLQGRGVPLEDLIQEGAFGVMRAIDKFDPSQGRRLTTYATWWIRQVMFRAVMRRSLIHVPEYLQRNKGVPPSASLEERAADAERAVNLQSLDGGSSHETIPARDTADTLEREELLAELDRRLLELHPKEREVLTRRSRGDTLVQIGATLGVSKERVRQIEAKAIERLAKRLKSCAN